MLGRQLPLLSKFSTRKVFWSHTDRGFCGLATQNTAKIAQDWLKANLTDHLSKEIWPPSSKDYFIRSEVEREVNKQPHNTLASLKAMIPDVMANQTGRCHSCMQEVPVLD
jgi:hypothetical protein